jgi:hypothetical protein
MQEDCRRHRNRSNHRDGHRRLYWQCHATERDAYPINASAFSRAVQRCSGGAVFHGCRDATAPRSETQGFVCLDDVAGHRLDLLAFEHGL